MSSVEPRDWVDAITTSQPRVREFAFQLAKLASGRVVARVIVRTPSGAAVIDARTHSNRSLSLPDISQLTTSMFDAIVREATILGGVQLSMD